MATTYGDFLHLLLLSELFHLTGRMPVGLYPYFTDMLHEVVNHLPRPDANGKRKEAAVQYCSSNYSARLNNGLRWRY
jgi:hypothetical protein